jgi:hypothetical protein
MASTSRSCCTSGSASDVMRALRSLLLLLGCLASDGAPAQFVETELDLGLPVDNRLALPGFNGSPGAILLTGRSAEGDKYLALYDVRPDGTVDREPADRVSLAKGALFFDTGRIGVRNELLLLTSTGVSKLAPTGVVELIRVESIYKTPSSAALTKLDFITDVNGDGLDDIVLPDFEGLRVALQSQSGFDDFQLLELPPLLTVSGSEARYRADRLYSYDFNGDGRKDVAVIRNGRFFIFDAVGERAFSRTPRVVPIDIGLADDAVVRRAQENLIDVDQSDFRLTQIADVKDLNGDGLPDIITFTAISKGLFDKRTEYHIHLGRMVDGSIHYSATPDADIPSDGVQLNFAAVDVNGDGRQDLVTTSFHLGFGELIGALFSRSVTLDVALYRPGTAPIYASAPDFRAKTKLQFSLSTGFISNPAVRFADFDGDGLLDLMLQDGSGELRIRRGSSQGAEFGSASRWSTRLPKDGTLVEIVDANGDSRQDVLVGYGRADGGDLVDRVRVLISAPASALDARR